jgi:hypothetical protein
MADERNHGDVRQAPTLNGLRSGTCRPRRMPFAGHSCCLTPDTPPKTPDPAIYSQREQLSLGNEPSWNNRSFNQDILALSYNPRMLPVGTDFWVGNRSPEVAAVGVLVSVSYSSFGIGLERRPLGSSVIGIRPGRRESVFMLYPPTLLPELGHLPALFVHIEHPLDENLISNDGEHAVQLYRTSEAGRTLNLQFPVRNDAPAARQISLAVLTNDLGAAVSPTNRLFAPFEQVNATLNVVVPATIVGSVNDPFPPQRTVTVMGQTADGQLVGGVSYIIRIDD